MKLLDSQWQKLEPLLIGKQGDPGAKGRDNRLFIDAVLWIISSKSIWRSLPAEFGKWNTTYMRFRRWNECDVWRQLEQGMYDDPLLKSMFHEIVEYGDRQTGRIRQRLARRANKVVYNSSLGKVGGARKNSPGVDESTSHWVGLVMRGLPV
ncbi:transposase [Collimonas sp. H4R21]|jgi:transposase|uniref:Transposase n=1 Tax=Collimonas rhizosphaerae TaxID=3126357 RepID=A0ABU9Q120_9BURK|nr:transposase [Collimonas sp. OK412]SFC90604.1 Putative transposase of IS4/5 family [Collimonas sp. OK412]